LHYWDFIFFRIKVNGSIRIRYVTPAIAIKYTKKFIYSSSSKFFGKKYAKIAEIKTAQIIIEKPCGTCERNGTKKEKHTVKKGFALYEKTWDYHTDF